MNTTYSVYTLAGGLFTGQTLCVPDADLQANTPEGCGVMQGQHDPLRWRVNVSTGDLVELLPEQPQGTELLAWIWDETLTRWVASPTLEGHRQALLDQIKRALTVTDGGADRAVRELLLASDISAPARARMQAIEDRAAVLRALVLQAEAATDLAALAQVEAALQVVQATA